MRASDRKGRKLTGWLLAFLLGSLLVTDGSLAAGEWVPVGPMLESRSFFGAARLDDGRVLAVGGRRAPANFITQAEIYDPSTGFFTPTGSLAVGRLVHDVVKLNDGRVLVPGTAATPNEIFNPDTGVFAPTGAMITPREGAAMALLPDGKVLFSGGRGAGNAILGSAEIFDPLAGTYAPTGGLNVARSLASDASLNDGRILVIGGEPESGATEITEIYDPATGAFTASGSLNAERTGLQNAITLADGRVMVTGGTASATVPKYEVFNPLTGLFNGFYIRPRDADPTISLLADGTVLSAGELTEIVDPNTQIVNQFPGPFTWSGHEAVNLLDGQVLVFGGPHPTEGVTVPSRSYLYYPNGVPAPTLGETANLKEVSGKTFYTCPRQGAFDPVPNKTQIRVGCEVDTRKGTIELATEYADKMSVQRARFWKGIFEVTQSKRTGETRLTLSGKLNCAKNRRSIRGLWGRTASRYSSQLQTRRRKKRPRYSTWGNSAGAGVRGTTWYVEDRCDKTTLVKVREGVVSVTDFVKKKTFRLKAPKSYVAGKERRR